jgi:hypothetical protein
MFFNTMKLSGSGIHTDANINYDVRYNGGGVGTATVVTVGNIPPSVNRAIGNACQNDATQDITVPVGSTPGTLTVSGWMRIVINGHVAGVLDRGFAFVSAAGPADCGTDIARSYWRAQ